MAEVAAEVVWIEAPDGDVSALTHHPGGGEPVVLCHGISSNARFWDLSEGRSLAAWLVSRGYDVWNLDLRGHGLAVRDAEGRRQRAGWNVDDYGKQDLPAVFAEVKRRTGADRVHFVGHSMGGMVLAVYLASTPEPPLASAVVVGSPLDFRDPDGLFTALLTGAPWMTSLPFVPTPAGAWLAARLRGGAIAAEEILYNPENLAEEADQRAMMDTVVSPLSRGEIRQFGLARSGEFVSADGAVRYRESLGEVQVPMLFLAGRADRVVSPDRVWGYYEAVGSVDKRFLVLSDAAGTVADYGHLDLGDGDRAATEVFPLIGDWLAAHPTGSP